MLESDYVYPLKHSKLILIQTAAAFGQIQVHERITETSRELLMQIQDMAENMGFEVQHGIVDCLWVVEEPISAFKAAMEKETGILTVVDSHDWIAFLSMSNGEEPTTAISAG